MYDCPHCDRKFDTKQARGSHVGQSHDGNPTVKCENCGSKFEKVLSRVKEHDNHYCSDECRISWFKDIDSTTVGKSEYDCVECGKTVKRWPSQIIGAVLCSEECFSKYHTNNLTGEDNPNWKDGHRPTYGENWGEVRKEAIQRDGEKCKICGVGREEYINFNNRDLSVHHIKPLRSFDNVKKANKLNNLVTVCSSCHMKIENQMNTDDAQGSIAQFM